jgi:hypothetical protein
MDSGDGIAKFPVLEVMELRASLTEFLNWSNPQINHFFEGRGRNLAWNRALKSVNPQKKLKAEPLFSHSTWRSEG